jgi:hypothetical protein
MRLWLGIMSRRRTFSRRLWCVEIAWNPFHCRETVTGRTRKNQRWRTKGGSIPGPFWAIWKRGWKAFSKMASGLQVELRFRTDMDCKSSGLNYSSYGK